MPLPELFANPPTPGGSVPWALGTLSAGILSTSTTLTLSAAPPAALAQSGQFRIIIDNEIMLDVTGGPGATRTVVRGQEGSTRASHASGANVYHILTAEALAYLKAPADQALLQSGVLNSGDLAISGLSINSSTGALTFTLGSALPYWIPNALGILIPVYFPGGTYTIIPPSLPPSLHTYVLGIEIDTSGNIALTSTSIDVSAGPGASQVLAGGSGGPATTSLRLRIANVAIWNNSGVYVIPGSGAQGVGWLDRRLWARGFFGDAIGSTNGPTTTSGAYSLVPDMQLRVECAGNPLKVDFSSDITFSGGSDQRVLLQLFVDGGAVTDSSTIRAQVGPSIQPDVFSASWLTTPSVGSHLVGVYWASPDSITVTATGVRRQMIIQEFLRSRANNGTS